MDNSNLPKHRPIIILGASRSGTSLTAGIFERHGVWVGRTQPPQKMNEKGFFENIDFKAYLKDKYLPIENLQYPEPLPCFNTVVESCLAMGDYNDGKYMFKHGGIHWRLWLHLNPIYVCVRRPYKQSNESRAVAGIPEMPKRMWHRIQDGMDECVEKYGGVNVYTDEFLKGDFASIISALLSAGITPDIEKIENFYDPNLWHHRT